MSTFKIFDSHFHIIDRRFPLIPNEGYVPDEFSCEDYLARAKSFPLAGGAIVSGSFQAFDQTYLIDALVPRTSGNEPSQAGSPFLSELVLKGGLTNRTVLRTFKGTE